MKLRDYLLHAVLVSVMTIALSTTAVTQDEKKIPDKAVAGIELGNRERSEKFLSSYGPTIGEDGRPNYYFYNKYATQVLRAVALSFEDPFYVTEIEVYAVGKSYQRKHFQLKDIGYFKSDLGVFIGYKQSAASILSGFAIGINNPGGKNRIGPNSVRGLNGEPDEQISEEDREIFRYEIENVELDDGGDAAYKASYEFRKSKLRKFRISIEKGEDPEKHPVAEAGVRND